jgi:hypothetical protein
MKDPPEIPALKSGEIPLPALLDTNFHWLDQFA